MSAEPTKHPLQWVTGYPRTKPNEISRNGRWRSTIPQAVKELTNEVRLLGGDMLILSSNVTLGAEYPKDRGVVAYFRFKGKMIGLPCDSWDRVEHNVIAIARTINAMRAMKRNGVGPMVDAMFTSFKMLPASTESWWTVLGLPANATAEDVVRAHRELSKTNHPDHGGDAMAMAKINEAKARALGELK